MPRRVHCLEPALDLLRRRSDTIVTSDQIADRFLPVDETGLADIAAAVARKGAPAAS